MTASLTDPHLFIKGNATAPPANLGVISLQVDDNLVTGSALFQALEESKSKRFLGTPAQIFGTNKNISFNGATSTKSSSGTISMQQLLYCRSLPSTPVLRTPSSFATARGKSVYATTST
jgi:hypothetical protein